MSMSVSACVCVCKCVCVRLYVCTFARVCVPSGANSDFIIQDNLFVKPVMLPEQRLKQKKHSKPAWGTTPRRVCQTHHQKPSAEFSRGVAATMRCCCEQLRAILLGF